MTSVSDSLLIYILLATALLLVAVVLFFAFGKGKKQCTNCGTPLPRFRQPQNKRQRLWGGWTCPNCGKELDRKGKVISD